MNFLGFTKKKIIVSLIVFLGTLLIPLKISLLFGPPGAIKLGEIYFLLFAVTLITNGPLYTLLVLLAFLVHAFLVYFIASLIMHFFDKR